MLLDDTGLKVGAFDPVLAAVLGSAPGGENLLGVAISLGRTRVLLRDWLYCLGRAPGTEVRKRLIDMPGRKVEAFVSGIEGAADDDDSPPGLPPDRFTAQCAAEPVLRMLDAAERMAREYGLRNINDAVLTCALFEVADESLKQGMILWAREDGFKKFLTHLQGVIGPPPDVKVFADDGTLIYQAFTSSGRRFCGRLAEDIASMGAKKVTTRHFLYTLLGDENGLLTTALAVRGIDVKKELHSALSRELIQPGKKRTEGFALGRATAFDAIERIFQEAGVAARRRQAKGIAEYDISRAFVQLQGKELARLFPSNSPLDLAGLREYLESADPPEEDEKSAKKFSLREIEQNMKDRVCGQEQAIDRVLPWVKRLRFGLPRDGRPAAVFLFLGPTGAGKTQLAKELARYVYGDPEQMIFLEMGQFKTKESMNMFIGSPPGYIGYGEGKLTNGLRDKPECIVLFDEIEKADIQVFDVLLRFADEGMISDPAGPIRDGSKCVIVMTTNAGQAWLRANPDVRETPDLGQKMFEAAMQELQEKGFRPEFLGRVDERISFLPFTRATCRKIIDGVLKRELEKFKKLKGIVLEVPDAVRDFLAGKAHERSMDEGARGAPRAINDHIVTPAIDMLARGEDESGDAPLHLIASMHGLDRVVLEPAGDGAAATSDGRQEFKPMNVGLRT